MSDDTAPLAAGDRLAKVIARAGLCSRRDAEFWIKEGRVTVNGRKVLTPAFNVTASDKVKVDGEPLAARQGTRVWLYHKPAGLVVTEKDPEGRPTIFEALEETDLPRVVSIGRLDINTEGLLLLTNDGGLKRVLELPATGWLRRYRVRAYGSVTQAQLDGLKGGIEIDGIQYGPIDAQLERDQGSNVWLVLGLREGKNREVKNVLGALGLKVNRLIRVSFGPFQLGDLAEGAVEAVPARILRDQLGKRLAAEANTDFDSDMPEVAQAKKRAANPGLRAAAPGKPLPKASPRRFDEKKFRFEDDETIAEAEKARAERPRIDRPGRGLAPKARLARPDRPERVRETRRVLFDDGTEGEIEVKPERRERPEARWDAEDSSAKNFGRPRHHDEPIGRGPKKEFGDRPEGRGPRKSFGDRPEGARGPKKAFGDRPPRGDRPEGARGPRKEFGDRPARSFGDRPPRGDRPEGGRGPRKEFGDRPARSFGDRPERKFGDRPEGGRGPRKEFGDRPPLGDRPEGARGPRKEFGDRPPRKEFGDRPARSFGDRPPRGDRPDGSKPYGKGGGKPFGKGPGAGPGRGPGAGKSFGDRPGRPAGAGRPGGDRPGGRPSGGRPSGGRPSGDRPGGSRPLKPRPPKA